VRRGASADPLEPDDFGLIHPIPFVSSEVEKRFTTLETGFSTSLETNEPL